MKIVNNGGPRAAFFDADTAVLMPSPQRRSANNKSARCALNETARQEACEEMK
jgi:hypothetical protein